MEQALTVLMQQVANLTAAVEDSRQLAQVQSAQTAQAVAEAARLTATNRRPEPLVDKVPTKLQSFDGKATEWPDSSSKLKSYFAAASLL
eukprot:10312723-Alexandrium_andersonii.AAC.1